MPITLESLQERYDFTLSKQRVHDALDNATQTPDQMVRFIFQYTDWNGYFGSGVASLAGKVGRSRGLFFDQSEAIHAVSDRSVYIASYIFDAARAEFDDRANPARDTHRCLAQALLLGAIQYYEMNPAAALALCGRPLWLANLGSKVSQGYGLGSSDELSNIARALGYHMGSEVLAATEFSEIDMYITRNQHALHADLQHRTVNLNGVNHPCYHWLSIHSDYGGGVEMEHFDDAIEGIRLAVKFIPERLADEFLDVCFLGFDDFCRDHEAFFARVAKD